VTKCFEARFKARDAHCRGPHVNAAARLAEVEGDSDDANLAGSDAGG
jgi:hypothetical protein